MLRFIKLMAFLGLAGCQIVGNATKTNVVIDDGRTCRGPAIASVDGQPPKRSSHPVHTLVPHVLVEPGIHTIEFEGSAETIELNFAPGQNYRTTAEDGAPMVVPDPLRPHRQAARVADERKGK